MAFVSCCAGFVMYVWSQSLAKCITTYWGTTIVELPNDIAMAANIVWIWSHLLRISHHCLMGLSSPSCKTLALKGIPRLHGKSSCQWSQGSRLSMDIDAKQMDVCTAAPQGRLWAIIVMHTIFSYQLMLVINHATCSTFLKRSGTPHILVLTIRIWNLQVTRRGSN